MDKKIAERRKEVDILDQKIMEHLERRFHLTNEIGRLKKETNTIVLDSNREQLIFNKTSKYSHSPEIKEIYKTIMSESKKQQRKL